MCSTLLQFLWVEWACCLFSIAQTEAQVRVQVVLLVVKANTGKTKYGIILLNKQQSWKTHQERYQKVRKMLLTLQKKRNQFT